MQECWIAWQKQGAKYDPARGASESTFLKRVARSALKDLVKQEEAQGRWAGKGALSLDAGTPLALAAPIDVDDIGALESRLDISKARSQMTPRQRAIVDGVLAGYRPDEIARQLGVSRDTVHQDRVKLRSVLAVEDLK